MCLSIKEVETTQSKKKRQHNQRRRDNTIKKGETIQCPKEKGQTMM
jgi:hypothetical protein